MSELKPCPIPRCGSNRLLSDHPGPDEDRPTMVHCRDCDFVTTIDYWQSLPRHSVAPAEVWVVQRIDDKVVLCAEAVTADDDGPWGRLTSRSDTGTGLMKTRVPVQGALDHMKCPECKNGYHACHCRAPEIYDEWIQRVHFNRCGVCGEVLRAVCPRCNEDPDCAECEKPAQWEALNEGLETYKQWYDEARIKWDDWQRVATKRLRALKRMHGAWKKAAHDSRACEFGDCVPVEDLDQARKEAQVWERAALQATANTEHAKMMQDTMREVAGEMRNIRYDGHQQIGPCFRIRLAKLADRLDPADQAPPDRKTLIERYCAEKCFGSEAASRALCRSERFDVGKECSSGLLGYVADQEAAQSAPTPPELRGNPFDDGEQG